MLIIPALDLKNNIVVRACGGARASYKPLQTKSFPSPELSDVITRMREIGKFKTFYIADLDAIENGKTNKVAIDRATKLNARCEFWIDVGIKSQSHFNRLTWDRNCAPIIATETLADKKLLTKLQSHNKRWILSLDAISSKMLGLREAHTSASYWPDKVILLDLGRVGRERGPDLARIARAKPRAKNRKLFIGGGVRNLRDVLSAKRSGACGALAASAIYEGIIRQDTIV